MTAEDNDWPEEEGGLRKLRKSWAYLVRILGRVGTNPRVSGMFSKAVVHVVMLFGSETRVVIPHMGQELGSFQHGVSGCITERQSKRREEGVWEYPPMASAMKETGFEEIGAYILKRKFKVVYYIMVRLIMDL